MYFTLNDTSDTILLVLLVVGLYTDIRFRKLPNWLTFPAIIIGIGMHIWANGWQGAADSLGGVLFALVLFLPFIQGGLGGGDLKFLAAIGAVKGFEFVLWTTLFGAFLGGLVSVVVLLRQKRLKYELWRSFLFFKNLGTAKEDRPDLKPERQKKSMFPYGVVLVFGAVLWRIALAYWR